MKDAYAARRLVVNRVQSENGTAPIDEPGQTLTGEVFDSERLLMLEAYFDDSHWVTDFSPSRRFPPWWEVLASHPRSRFTAASSRPGMIAGGSRTV